MAYPKVKGLVNLEGEVWISIKGNRLRLRDNP